MASEPRITPSSILGRSGQRVLMVVTLVVALFALSVWPLSSGPTARALTDTHQCGPTDSYRATLRTYHGGITMRPCIADVNLKLKIPLGPWVLWCLCYERRFSVDEIRRIGSTRESVKMGNGTTESLWHLSFAKFSITKAGQLYTTDGNGYALNITPDAFAQLGGQNDVGTTMYTDLWVSGGNIGIAGFCSIAVDVSSPLVELVQGSDLSGCQMELDIKYLVTYNSAPGSTGQYPLRLPLTNVTVS